MGDDAGVTRLLGHLDRLEGFGQRADLVHLDQDGVRRSQLDALLQALGVGDKQVVAHQLDPVSDAASQLDPAVPILLGHAVLDGDDGVLLNELAPVIDHLRAGKLAALALKLVHTGLCVIELGRRRVHGVHKVHARGVAGLLDRLVDVLKGLGIGLEVGGKAALIAHAAAKARLVQHALKRVVDLRAPAQALGKGGSAHRHDHELLEVHVVVRMHAAVQDVHHGRGQQVGVDAAQVAVQLKAGRLRRRAGDGKRYAQDRVCAQVCLVGRAVRGDQGGVDRTLIKGVHTDHGVRALLVHMVDGLGNALAQIAIAIAIAQLNSLKSTGGSAGGHHRTAKGAIIEHNFHLNGGIAARVQDLATVHIENLTHIRPLSLDTRASDPAGSFARQKVSLG